MKAPSLVAPVAEWVQQFPLRVLRGIRLVDHVFRHGMLGRWLALSESAPRH
jgi:hypothetical protein